MKATALRNLKIFEITLLFLLISGPAMAQSSESMIQIAGQPYPGGYLGSPYALDTDGDGLREVYYSEFFSLLGFEPGGQARLGFPVNLALLYGGQAEIAGRMPAFADFDSDGQVEIVLPLRSGPLGSPGPGRLFVLNNHGQVASFWPPNGVTIPNVMSISDRAVIAKVNGSQNILVPVHDSQVPRILMYSQNGNLLSILSLGHNQRFATGLVGIAAGDMDNDGNDEVAAVSERQLHLISLNSGLELPGFPINTVNGARFANLYPALGDIDNDGFRDVVVFDQTAVFGDLLIRIVNRIGQNLSGWPVTLASHGGWQRPTLADVNGDNLLDVISTVEQFSNPGGTNVYVHESNGAVLAGWPLLLTSPSYSYSEFITAVDLTGDNAAEMLMRDAGGFLFQNSEMLILSSNGSVLSQFPLSSFAPNTPLSFTGDQGVVATDLRNNGDAEISFGMQVYNLQSLSSVLPSDLPLAVVLDSPYSFSSANPKSWVAVDADNANTRSLPPNPTPTSTTTSTPSPTPTVTSTPAIMITPIVTRPIIETPLRQLLGGLRTSVPQALLPFQF